MCVGLVALFSFSLFFQTGAAAQHHKSNAKKPTITRTNSRPSIMSFDSLQTKRYNKNLIFIIKSLNESSVQTAHDSSKKLMNAWKRQPHRTYVKMINEMTCSRKTNYVYLNILRYLYSPLYYFSTNFSTRVCFNKDSYYSIDALTGTMYRPRVT